MPRRQPSSRVVAALVTGATTTLHYASADTISARRTRGGTKAALTGVAVTASVPELRATWSTERQAANGEASLAELFRSMPTARKAVALTPIVAVVGTSVGGLALVERVIFRRGQARAAAGKRLPHSGPALWYGTLAGLLWFVGPPG